jgi:head-tail adaptor
MYGPKTVMMLYTPTKTVTTTGATTKAWTPVRSLSGVVSGLSRDENMRYNKETVTARYKMRVDFMSGTIPKQGDQLRRSNKNYDITDVENPGMQDRMLNIYFIENT